VQHLYAAHRVIFEVRNLKIKNNQDWHDSVSANMESGQGLEQKLRKEAE
jgi:hypothetical protein